jgi:DNA-binding NarL/FixJ family response regulator
MQVLLVCDTLVRLGLRVVLGAAVPALTMFETSSYADAAAFLETHVGIAFVILSVNLPDCAGLMGLTRLRKDFPRLPIIVLSPHADPASIRDAMALGAFAFIPKTTSPEAMGNALKQIMAGSSWTPPMSEMRTDTVHTTLLKTLSPAQLGIFKFLSQGLGNREIATQMGVAEKTIKAYTTTLYRKLGVRNRAQALILAEESFAEWDSSLNDPSRNDRLQLSRLDRSRA